MLSRQVQEASIQPQSEPQSELNLNLQKIKGPKGPSFYQLHSMLESGISKVALPTVLAL